MLASLACAFDITLACSIASLSRSMSIRKVSDSKNIRVLFSVRDKEDRMDRVIFFDCFLQSTRSCG